MNRNNLHVLATCLSILISFFLFGCAQQSMTGSMDKGMGSATEEQQMEKPMQEMTDQNMDGTMDEMKIDAAKDDMDRQHDKPMNAEKEEMMK